MRWDSPGGRGLPDHGTCGTLRPFSILRAWRSRVNPTERERRGPSPLLSRSFSGKRLMTKQKSLPGFREGGTDSLGREGCTHCHRLCAQRVRGWGAQTGPQLTSSLCPLLCLQFGGGAVPRSRRIHPPGEHVSGRRWVSQCPGPLLSSEEN